jgi:histidinol dehydrogenase
LSTRAAIGSNAISFAVRSRVADLSKEDRELLLGRAPDDLSGVQAAVAELIADVRTRGDAALIEMAKRFDGVDLGTIEIPRDLWRAAVDEIDPLVRAALERAAANIRAFHEAQIPADVELEVEPGVKLGRRFVPLAAVGVYAPGGRAAYPSSVLMGVVPAVAAGVGEIVVCSPPGPGGLPSREVLAAAEIAGATRLYAVGGAGAVAAMAYGAGSIPRCAAVVGPGNKWVLEAKRQVAGEVVIDSPAGPSEVLVLADDSAEPARVAAELVAQAEHDPEAAVALVSTSPDLLAAAEAALARQLADAPRRDVIEEALRTRGGLLLADTPGEAVRFADAYAAEHLAIYTEDPRRDLADIRTAGTAFLGAASAVAFGDYITGANHVLPTAGTSRSFSGLSTLHYLRSYTWQDLSEEGAAALAADTERLALAEGLPGHAAAAAMRADAHGAARGASDVEGIEP